MSHFMSGPELKLHLAGQDDAFAEACRLLERGEIGPHRFWYLAAQFTIDALAGKPARARAPEQADLFPT